MNAKIAKGSKGEGTERRGREVHAEGAEKRGIGGWHYLTRSGAVVSSVHFQEHYCATSSRVVAPKRGLVFGCCWFLLCPGGSKQGTRALFVCVDVLDDPGPVELTVDITPVGIDLVIRCEGTEVVEIGCDIEVGLDQVGDELGVLRPADTLVAELGLDGQHLLE